MSTLDELDEPHRHRCEVRFWLDRDYTTRAKVDSLMRRIAKHRGRAAAEKLREGMREEWERRQIAAAKKARRRGPRRAP